MKKKILNPIFVDKELRKIAKRLGFIKNNRLNTETGVFMGVPFRMKTELEIVEDLLLADDETGANFISDYYDRLYDRIVKENDELSIIEYDAFVRSENIIFDEEEFYDTFSGLNNEEPCDADICKWEVDLQYELHDFIYKLNKLEYEWGEECDNEIRDLIRQGETGIFQN